jgi:hypothetical protein
VKPAKKKEKTAERYPYFLLTGEAIYLLAAKLGRAVYWMLRRKTAFDVNKLFAS